MCVFYLCINLFFNKRRTRRRKMNSKNIKIPCKLFQISYIKMMVFSWEMNEIPSMIQLTPIIMNNRKYKIKLQPKRFDFFFFQKLQLKFRPRIRNNFINKHLLIGFFIHFFLMSTTFFSWRYFPYTSLQLNDLECSWNIKCNVHGEDDAKWREEKDDFRCRRWFYNKYF